MLKLPSQHPLILLAEDEAIIAMELADSLEREGFVVAGPFDTCAAAKDWLGDNTPAAALIDNRLRDGPCEALARDLSVRQIPFVVYSGEYVSPVPAAFRCGT
jgi:DNA-binding response OmpR family regulator